MDCVPPVGSHTLTLFQLDRNAYWSIFSRALCHSVTLLSHTPFAGAGESTGAFSESGDTHLCPREMTHQRAFLSHTGAFHFARNSRTISAISGSPSCSAFSIASSSKFASCARRSRSSRFMFSPIASECSDPTTAQSAVTWQTARSHRNKQDDAHNKQNAPS